MCCQLPDCWSIKIIVMEIDLIDNVPCSHCEQLVPCEHNPEMSSKNFPPQTFNPSSFFLSSSPEDQKGRMPEKTKSFYVKYQQKRWKCKGTGLGSKIRIERKRTNDVDSRSEKDRGLSKTAFHIHLTIPENPLLSSVSNSKIPDFGPQSTVPAWLHTTCKLCQERWHLADPHPS